MFRSQSSIRQGFLNLIQKRSFLIRRWQSEYQSTYKPFSRFDYKNGKWYKDTAAVNKNETVNFSRQCFIYIFRRNMVLIRIYFGIKN